MDRRSFIRTSILSAAAAAVLPGMVQKMLVPMGPGGMIKIPLVYGQVEDLTVRQRALNELRTFVQGKIDADMYKAMAVPPRLWAKELWRESSKDIYFKKFMYND